MMKKEALLLSLCLLMATPGGMVSMADAPAELEPAIMASAEQVEAENQKKEGLPRASKSPSFVYYLIYFKCRNSFSCALYTIVFVRCTDSPNSYASGS